jgi:hypothetical protein
MSGDVVHVVIMRQALRELGEGFAVYSGRNSNEPRSFSGAYVHLDPPPGRSPATLPLTQLVELTTLMSIRN